MSDELALHRNVEAVLSVRAGATDDRIIEGRIVPFGVVTTVQDQDVAGRAVGRPYREVIVDATLDPAGVTLENGFGVKGGHRGPIAGRSVSADKRPDGQYVAFRAYRTQAGNDLYELAREGYPVQLSIEIEPDGAGTLTRRRPDGVVERTAGIRRVAALERGAYPGAEVTAVRAEVEGNMPENEGTTPAQPAAAQAGSLPGQAVPIAGAPAVPLADAASTEQVLAARQAAERSAVATMGRSAAPVTVTRDELVYGPTSEASFLGDLVAMHEPGSPIAGEARDRMGRHYAMLASIEGDLVRSRAGYADFGRVVRARTGISLDSGPVMGRAGDVLTTEIPGAYPNTYLPGLLTPRIIKGRPMGGFYMRVPISNAQPQIFPKVTTSTSVAAQAAEGTNPAASDFATTAVTANPLLYGAETVISRQVLDGASPSAEGMVLDDMFEAYAQATEAIIKTAVEAGSTDSGTAITAATPFAGVQANVITHYTTRFKACEAVFGPSAGFGVLLGENDTTGRPKVPFTGPINSDATVDSGATGGQVLGSRLFLAYAATANVWVFARSTDFVIFESPVARFSYDATTGPSGVRMGVWAYLVVGARLGSLKRTAA